MTSSLEIQNHVTHYLGDISFILQIKHKSPLAAIHEKISHYSCRCHQLFSTWQCTTVLDTLREIVNLVLPNVNKTHQPAQPLKFNDFQALFKMTTHVLALNRQQAETPGSECF